MGPNSYTADAILDLEVKQNLLRHCGTHAHKTAKNISRWLKSANIYRLTNLDFRRLVTKHDVSALSHDDIAALPLGAYALEVDFSDTNIPTPLPGGYTVPGQTEINASSKRIALLVRLNANRLFEFVKDAGQLAKNGIRREDYSRGGLVVIPIAYMNREAMWVAAYGCAVVSATPLRPETPEEKKDREIREARYTEHCTDSGTSAQAPLPYHLLVTIPEIVPQIPNVDHLDEMLLADCNDEFVIGYHFIYAKMRDQIKNGLVETLGKYTVNHVTLEY